MTKSTKQKPQGKAAPLQQRLEALRLLLQAEPDAKKLEQLGGALIGELLGVGVAVAKSGFQAGGDGGTGGRAGRRLRLETKKYADTTSLSERELLGEMAQAFRNDPALEAWILIATRNVSEQLETELSALGEREGAPAIIIDWKSTGTPALAALCAFKPPLVGQYFSPAAEVLSASLTVETKDALQQLRTNLQSWKLGYDTLRATSHEALESLWDKPRQAQAVFGQDVAGGARQKRIRREKPFQALNVWWSGRATDDAPAALLGYGGAGKTWAAFDWLVTRQDDLPIVVTVPASVGAELINVSETRLKEWLADRLYALETRRDRSHWLRRLERLLARPADEGPVLLLLLDGLNQESETPWLRVLKALQGETFAGRVRVILTTRPFHLNNGLARLSGLVIKPEEISVDLYDLTPGGELDQMLAFDGLTREALPGELLELARTPRLFDLVVRFGPKLVGAGQITVHRLLWEYGRDTLGVRAETSFSETEWRSWLGAIADRARGGMTRFTRQGLTATIDQSLLSPNETFQRLSDIVDGNFASADGAGSLRLDPTIVDHALAAALITWLNEAGLTARGEMVARLIDWLDPIAGLDQRAEILRAAVSIQVETGQADAVVTEVLLTAWLQGQNVPDTHRRELENLAHNLLTPLLGAVEHSSHITQASARRWALNAIAMIPRDNLAALATIVLVARRWLSVVSRGVGAVIPDDGAQQIEAERARRVTERMGFDRSGPAVLLGVPMQVVDQGEEILTGAAALVLEGFPLAPTLPVLEAAAIATAAGGGHQAWEALSWACQLNEKDPEETAFAIRAMAKEIKARAPEPDVSATLPSKVAARLLRLTGDRDDGLAASKLMGPSNLRRSYETDYLAQPGRSFWYALERRHAEQALADSGAGLQQRIDRAAKFLLDPTFTPPAVFVAEVIAAARAIDLAQLNSAMAQTGEDNAFAKLAIVLARSAPEILRELLQEKLNGYAKRPPSARYWSAIHAPDDLVALDGSERSAISTLRASACDPRANEESYAQARLMMVELRDLPSVDQFAAVIDANLTFMLVDLIDILKPCSAQDVQELFDRYSGSPKAREDLLAAISTNTVELSDEIWAWILERARTLSGDARGVAFRALWFSDPVRFGRTLLDWDWTCDLKNDEEWTVHYGSKALIAASMALPFEQVIARISPSLVLWAVHQRGVMAQEVAAAAAVIGRVLGAPAIEAVDLGAEITVERRGSAGPLLMSINARESDEATMEGGPTARLSAMFDDEARAARHHRAVEVTLQRIAAARRNGAELFLASLETRDVAMALDHSPEQVDRWLEGMETEDGDFDRRLGLAGGVYLTLCETLLARRPEQGVRLWRRLRVLDQIRYQGAIGLEDLLRAPFAAPSSPLIDSLRKELFDPPAARTDAQLFAIVQAALLAGREDWLLDRIAEDTASPLIWRQRRAQVVSAWTPGARHPTEWPEGESQCTADWLDRWADEQARTDTFARHWWATYQVASTSAEAIAAWNLFRKTADNRAMTWIDQERSPGIDAGLDHAKTLHEAVNSQDLLQALRKRAEKLKDRYLGQSIVQGFGLWRDLVD
jgi:hypothetical protein